MQKASRRYWGRPCTSAIPTIPGRETNENTNGLLRDWFPKGKSLDDVTDRKVQKVYDLLN
jgi:IS30 family transposase